MTSTSRNSTRRDRGEFRISRRAAVIGAIATGALPVRAGAQAKYPTRPVRIIVPFGPGGVTDVIMRIVAEKLADRLGQQFVVENQPGPGGIAAARSLLNSPADGYTLTLTTNGTALSVALFKALPFDPVNDFQPISMAGLFDAVFATSMNSPFKTLQDFISAAKERPGKLNVGTVVVGSSLNLAAELFKSVAGIDFQMVTFRNSSEVIVSQVRDDIHMLVEFYAAIRGPLADKQLRALATSGAKRSTFLPDTPTVSESGAPGYDVTSWAALVAKRGTPPEIVNLLNQSIRHIVTDQELRNRFAELGIEAQASTPEEPLARLREDIENWSTVVERAGIA
jgi:tripartite-type tricarboxylate transporter receptor subunit TctC